MKRVKRFLAGILAVCMILTTAAMPAQAAELPFKDVGPNDWFQEAVEYVYDNGLMTGMQDDVFGPATDMSRAMVVTVLYRMNGAPDMAYKAAFPDVPNGAWFASPVLWANEQGIVTGYENGIFGAADNITREQMATILYRYAKYRGLNTAAAGDLSGFADRGKVSGFAVDAMKWAVGAGLMKGLDETTLGPQGFASRAQVATLLMRFCTSEVLWGNESEIPVQTEGNYAICDVELDGRTISAVVSAEEACTLFVEVKGEEGIQSYFQQRTEVAAGSELETIEMNISSGVKLPEHFVIRAKLLNANGEVVCNPFTNRKYTEEYEKFAALKEADYPESRLIDLVDANDGNFAALHEGVVKLNQTSGKNTVVKREDGICVFENPDDVVSGLKAGDKICFRGIDGRYAAILVEKVEVKPDGSVAVYETTGVGISDFYETIKIDASLAAVTEENVSSYSNENLSQKKYLSDIEMCPAVTNTIETPFGSVTHTTTAGGKLEFNYYFVWDDDDYFEFTLLVGVTSDLDFKIGPNKVVKNEIELLSVPLLGVPDIAEIPAEVSLAYDIDCDAGASTNFKMEAAAGCVYNTKDGSQKVEYKEVTRGTTDIRGEIDATMGPKFSVNAEIFDDALKATLGAEGGVGFDGTAVAFTAPLPGTDSYHACDLCVDGAMKGYFEVEMTADYNISKKLQGSIADLDFIRLEWHLGKFYCSLVNEVDSVHKGESVFDFGECPNSKYKTILSTYKNKQPMTGCLVEVKKADATPVKTDYSVMTLYLYPGNYMAKGYIDGRTDQENFSIADSPVNVNLSVQDHALTGIVTDKATGKVLSDASVVVRQNGTTVATTSTNTSGAYEIFLIEGSYEVEFSANGYNSQKADVSVNADKQVNAALEKTAIMVTFKPVYFGTPIPGAIIEGTGLGYNPVTGADGTVTVEMPAGRYSFTARGAGNYGNASADITKSCTIVIDLKFLDHL